MNLMGECQNLYSFLHDTDRRHDEGMKWIRERPLDDSSQIWNLKTVFDAMLTGKKKHLSS